MVDAIETSIAPLCIRRYIDVAAFLAHIDGHAVDAANAGSSRLLLPELTYLGLLWGDPNAGETTVAGIADLYWRRLSARIKDV